MAVAVGWLTLYQARAAGVAAFYVRAVGPWALPFKAQTLLLQRAALRQANVLPIYGTSELYCCASSYNAGVFFDHAPTGFAVFNVGYPVTQDLFFAETFGALGTALDGKKVVVSDSAWFTAAGGVAQGAYAHTYSEEIATAFAFGTPLRGAIRQAVARRMLVFPGTLQNSKVLRVGLEALARGGRRGEVTHALLAPLGHLLIWIGAVRDAYMTVRDLQGLEHPAPPVATSGVGKGAAAGGAAAGQGAAASGGAVAGGSPARQGAAASRGAVSGTPAGQGAAAGAATGASAPPLDLAAGFAALRREGLVAWLDLTLPDAATMAAGRSKRGLDPVVADHPAAIDWNAALRRADGLAAGQSTNNPFGVIDALWSKCSDVQPGDPWCGRALQLYHSGRSNHFGGVYAYPTPWVAGVDACTCWTDLQLEFEVLQSLHAHPLAWVQPLQGHYSDYTPYSAAARRVLYDRYLATAAATGVPATTFATHDTDPLFVDSFGHMSQRGWVYADRLLNLFWQGQLGLVRGEMRQGGSVDRLFPPALNCPTPSVCAGVDSAPPAPARAPGREVAPAPAGASTPGTTGLAARRPATRPVAKASATTPSTGAATAPSSAVGGVVDGGTTAATAH